MKQGIVRIIKTAAVLAITGCVSLFIYKVCFESVRTVFTNGNVLGEVKKHSVEEYDRARVKAQSMGLFHKEIWQLAADTAGLLASVATFAVETGDAASDVTGAELRKLHDRAEELRAKATNLSAKTTDRITLETPANCLAYLKFADEKVLSQYDKLRKYERASGNSQSALGDFVDYCGLIDKFADSDRLGAFVEYRKMKIEDLIRKRQAESKPVFDIQEKPSDPHRYQELDPLLSTVSKEWLLPVIRGAASAKYQSFLPIPSATYADIAVEIGRLESRCPQYPSLTNFHQVRINFLKQFSGRLRAVGDNPALLTNAPFQELTVPPYDEDRRLSREAIAFEGAWLQARKSETQSGCRSSQHLMAQMASWSNVMTNAHTDILLRVAERHHALYKELEDALRIEAPEDSWGRLANLRTAYFSTAPDCWRRLFHTLRHPKMPVGKAEDAERLAQQIEEEAKSLSDPDESMWAAKMAKFLRDRAGLLQVKKLDDLRSQSFAPTLVAELENPQANNFAEALSAIRNAIEKANSSEDSLASALVAEADAGKMSQAETAVRKAHADVTELQIPSHQIPSQWGELAKARQQVWLDGFEARRKRSQGNLRSLLESYGKASEHRPAYHTFLAAALYESESLKIGDVPKLEGKIEDFRKTQVALEKSGEKEIAGWYQQAIEVTQAVKTILDGASWLEQVYSSNGTTPQPTKEWRDALASNQIAAWSRRKPSGLAAAVVDDFGALRAIKEKHREQWEQYQQNAGRDGLAQRFVDDKVVSDIADDLEQLAKQARLETTATIAKKFADDVATMRDRAKVEEDGKWTDAIRQYEAAKPLTSAGALFKEARIRRLHFIVEENNYAIPASKSLYLGDVNRWTKHEGSGYYKINGNSVAASWRGTSHFPKPTNTETWIWNDKACPFTWRAGQDLTLTAGPDDGNEEARKSFSGSHALRDLAERLGLSLEKIGFPYPWPTATTIIKPDATFKPRLDDVEKLPEDVIKRGRDQLP